MTGGLTDIPATRLSLLLREGAVSCREVVEAHLRRIDDLNPVLNAFCTILHEQALDAARRADEAAAAGRPLGPLHGLPVALKDLTPTRGVRTTRGSRLFADHRPAEDAVIVRRIRAAGGIIVGKTNTPEFGHKAVTDNLVFGPTRNPWLPERVAGGSSGGSCAAVAAGLVPLAEGSDGAGSIRIPAALCGVFGFKPSYGRVPDVLGPFSSHSPFFHNGPIARTVADAALLYRAMAGFDPGHPFSVPTEAPPADALDGGIAGLRVGWSADLGIVPVDAEVRDLCHRAADALGGLGCAVDTLDTGLAPDLEEQFRILWCGRMAAAWDHLSPEEEAKLEPVVRSLIAHGRTLGAVAYAKANLARERAWAWFQGVFRRFDLLVCPTTAVAAFPIADGPPDRIAGRAVDPLLGWFLTWPANLTGHPAASVPCGRTADGAPVGLQVIGRRLDDALVLRACRSIERARPWPQVAPDAPLRREAR